MTLRSRLNTWWEPRKKKLKLYKRDRIVPALYSIEASLIKLKFRFKKVIRIIIVCIIGIAASALFIILFAQLFQKTNSLKYADNSAAYPKKVEKELSPSDYKLYSIAIYFTGSYNEIIPADKTGKQLFLLEGIISFLVNSIFIGFLTFHFLKSEKTISLSKYVYITKKDDKIILRTRIADFLNNYVNHHYVIEFYYWSNDQFRTTYLTFEYKIAELAYVFNTWTKLISLSDTASDPNSKKNYDYFKYLFSHRAQGDRHFMCIILSGSSRKNGEPVVVKKYYTLDDIKFCKDCIDVFQWTHKYPYVTKRIWGNLNRYTKLPDVDVTEIKSKFQSLGKDLPELQEWEIN